MARALVAFFQAQALPRAAGPAGRGFERKRLAHDPEDGVATLPQRAPADFPFGNGTPLAANEAFRVVGGPLCLDGFA